MFRYLSAAPALALVAALLVGCGSTQQLPSQQNRSQTSAPPSDPSVVALIDDQPITLSEFEREYAKSNGGYEESATDSMSAYRDFLNRYVDFKLKVNAARKAGMMQDSMVQAELAAYRERLARPYMLDKEILEPVVRDLYERRQTVVSTSHILVKVAPNASPEDTLAAYQKATALLDSLHNGADFGELAFKYSDDPSAQRPSGPGSHGKLGPIPAGMLVQEYEDMAYATPVGQISPVFRSQFGYHILRVNDRQPAVPQIHVAQINIVPQKGNAADSARVRHLLDSLKVRVEAGEAFDSLAQKYSEHKAPPRPDGDIGFDLNYYTSQGAPEAFVEAAFALKNVGDVSDVIATPYGLHLIQLQGRQDLHNFDAMHDELRNIAQRMPRTREAQMDFLRRIQNQYHLSVDSMAVLNALGSIAPDSLPARLQRLTDAEMGVTIARLGDSTYTLADLSSFARRKSVQKRETTRQELLDLLNRFVLSATVDYAGMTLETRSPEFHQTMSDFRDGLLLFQIMQDSVWTAAANDSTGLQAYYLAHRDEYQYPDRTRLVVFYSNKKDELEQVARLLDENRGVPEIMAAVADSSSDLRVDTTYASEETNSVLDAGLQVPSGSHSAVVSTNDLFALVLNLGMEAARPMTFEEARGQAETDYQKVLETRLVQRLRREHSVRLYPDRLRSAFSQPQSTQTAAVVQ